jgi:hypothetical protein
MGILNVNPQQQQALAQLGLLRQHHAFATTQAAAAAAAAAGQQQAAHMQQQPQFSSVPTQFPQPHTFPFPPSIQQQWAGQKMAQLSGFPGQFLPPPQQQQPPAAPGFGQPLQTTTAQPQWNEHDIFGLAEKAEEAVKLLGSQNPLSLGGLQQFPVSGQPFPQQLVPNLPLQQLMPGAQFSLASPQQQQQQQFQQANAAAMQSRQNISQNDLPITIQFALQVCFSRLPPFTLTLISSRCMHPTALAAVLFLLMPPEIVSFSFIPPISFRISWRQGTLMAPLWILV